MDRTGRHDDTAELLVEGMQRRFADRGDTLPCRELGASSNDEGRYTLGVPRPEASAHTTETHAAELTADPIAQPVAEPIAEPAAEAVGASELAPPEVSRKVRRRARRTRPRSKTIAMKRLTREELRIGALLNPPVDLPRPVTRAECHQDARPCPWVACKHHLYLDVNPDTGSIKINFPDLEPWELSETCALDIAERGGITLEEVGEIMNLTRERIRQVEVRGLVKLKMLSPSPDELGGNIGRGDR
jgi:hypothetical protein